ncbi:MAG: peptidoglycan recognition protein [Deltaproteobacteria bacterium]|nr:peptidoglycan recognition protein [Deltaproteobacteria bacterium]
MRTPSRLALLLLLGGCVTQLGAPVERHSHDDSERIVAVDEVPTVWDESDEWLVSPTLESSEGASRVGVLVTLLEAGPLPELEARVVRADGTTGAWSAVEETWGEEEVHVAIADLGEVGTGAQLRMRPETQAMLDSLQWNAVIPEIADTGADDGVGSTASALRSELSGMGIVTRSAWGARATRCSSRNGTMNRMAIHHTVTPSANPERQVRGIQRYHMDSRGWCDVGYHFLVGIDGTVYEGRPLHLVGAHVGGHNTNNIGISFVGCFTGSGCPSGSGPSRPPEVMIDAAARLVGKLSTLFGIPINGSTVKGHRDHSGQSTGCPGDFLHSRLGDIRSRASSSPAPTPTPSPGGGACTHSYGGTYADTACSAGYQCCDGAWRTRGACGSCACVETTGETGCSPAPAPTPDGASCNHTYGGTYGDGACSTGYQCCDGTWRTRGACGGCTCVEGSGEVGCGGGPPAGASCAHSYGGTYANTACSAGYQCCDGRWGTRGSCGSCYCVEETGSTGCGI